VLEGSGERDSEAGAAADSRGLRPNHGQRQKGRVVTCKARPQPGAQEGRFSGTRGAKYDKQRFDPSFRDTADTVETAHDRRVATEEDRRILRLERFEPAIGRAVGLVPRRPGKAVRVETGAVEATTQQIESRFAEGDPLGLAEDLDLERAEAIPGDELA
jgi:hypothetical protein